MNKAIDKRGASGENVRGIQRRSVIIGLVGALVAISVTTFFMVGRSVQRKNVEIFKVAIEQKDSAAARAVVEKIQKRYDPTLELQALEIFETEQAAYLAEVGADAALLEKNGGEEWTQVVRLVEKAVTPGDPAEGTELFKEARSGVARIRVQIAEAIQIKADFFNAWEMNAEQLEKYMPSMYQWFFFELKKARDITAPVEAGRVYKELSVKLEDAVRRGSCFQEKEQAMLGIKQQWLEAVGCLPPATVAQFETQASAEWVAIQQRAGQAEAHELNRCFRAAKTDYATATQELKAMMQAGYFHALETVAEAVVVMDWDMAYATLDQADKSGYSDLSEAKAVRAQLDQLLLPMREAKAAYEKVLANTDRALLEKHGGTEWVTIRQMAGKGALTTDPQQAAQYFNQAASQLSELVYPLYLRGAKMAMDSKQWNEARNLVHKASLIRQSKELDVLLEQLPLLRKGKAWTADLGNGVSMAFVSIPAGSFLMGGESGDPKGHLKCQVTFAKPFWLGTTEVTQAQYSQIMGTSPSHFKGGQSPVEKISWNDAVSFCKKLTEHDRRSNRLPAGFEYMLPTEAQWEYSCRAGTTNDFAGNLDAMGWYSSNAGGKSHPVATMQPNAWGLYDMHGNVWEWCSDWSGDYSLGRVTDPEGAFSGTRRVRRGGSWNRYALYCRSAYRSGEDPSKGLSNLGFRVAVQKQKRVRY